MPAGPEALVLLRQHVADNPQSPTWFRTRECHVLVELAALPRRDLPNPKSEGAIPHFISNGKLRI